MTDVQVRDSALTVLRANSQVSIWGEDAPEVWRELSHCPLKASGASEASPAEVLVTSAAAADATLHDPQLFSSGPRAGYLGSETGLIPLQIDPPEHARYRRMLDPLFAPKRVAAIEADVTAFANSLIDPILERGSCNFSADFAIPFPVATFLRLLGLPVSGLPEFLQLKEDIIRPVADTVEAGNKIRERAGRDISTLFFNALAERETAPREDVLSQLVQREQAGELTREDSINICHLLLIAGLDTVTGTLECAFALLARRPDLQRQLGDCDGIDRAVEELLRWIVTSPAQSRVTTADTVIEGVAVAEGTVVRIVQATINFDPDRFENPTEVDLGRVSNRHASFGIGVHRCLGSHLARLELRVALAEWHRRVPAYQLPADYEVKYTQSLRGVTDLPLVISSRP